jgi:cytochrome P450
MFGPAPTTLPTGPRALIGNAVFRDSFIEASELVAARRGWSPWRSLDSDSPPDGVTTVERNFVQEVALQLALFRAIQAEGVEYDAVAGISLGDGAAAHAAGLLSFEDTIHVTCETIKAVLSATGGDLVAVQTAPGRVREVVDDPEVQLIIDWSLTSVWAVPDASARRMGRQLRVARIPYARLGFNCMSHTSRVDKPGMKAGLADLPLRAPSRVLYSTFEGGLVTSSDMTDRSVRIISEPVRLEAMWKALREDGYRDVLYIGSIPADKDIFGGLPRREKPAAYVNAESLIEVGPSVFPVEISIGGDAWPSSMAAAMRSASFARDPYSYYRRWHASGTVHRLPGEDTFVVIGFDAATNVLRNADIFSSRPFHHISSTLLGADAPEHTRMRRLLAPFFARERQADQRDAIASLTKKVIRDLRRNRKFDGVAALASRIPFTMACDWIGVNEREAAVMATMSQEEVTWGDVEAGMKPGGALEKVTASGDLTREEIQLLMPFLVLAGVTTTRDLLLFALFSLMRNRGLYDEVAGDPGSIPSFVEEMLRHEPPVHGIARRATRDVTIDGVDIPANSRVWVILAAANRDQSRFERADDFVMGRSGTKHLSFGHGPHFCLGSQLGRVETETVLEHLLPEIPRFNSMAPPEFFFTDIRDDVPWMRSMRTWQLSYRR